MSFVTRDTDDIDVYQRRYRNAKGNLLFVVILSAINLVLLATGGDSYFLFSASVPYIISSTMMFLCGMLPPEYYADPEFAGMEFFDPSFFTVALVISALIILFYAACWLFSGKNRKGWLIIALLAFIVDTIVMLLYYGFALDMIIDIALHIYVIISLISGISAAKNLD